MIYQTTVEISGIRIPTILKGTQFTIIHKGNLYSSCRGLPITLIWNDEFELVCGDNFVI